MNIIVCVKQVPDTVEAELSINESERNIKTEGLVFDINEWDDYALEEALLLKERVGGSVTAVTLGSEGADAVLRKCLAKGADRAIWLRDDLFEGSDAYATAKILHSAIKDLTFDLILTGVQANDDGHTAVGVMLAELLGVPHATMVKKIEMIPGEGIARVSRELEGGLEEIVEVKLPVVLTIQTGINEPRYVSIMGIRRARDKPIDILSLKELGLRGEEVGEAGSWIKVERMFMPPTEKEAVILSGSLDEMASNLVEILKARGLV